MGSRVDNRILRDRFEKLGWTAYQLAKECIKVRVQDFGEEEKRPATLTSSVSKVLDNPNAASFKNVEAAIKAMGGEITIRWTNTEQVVTGHEDIKL